MRLRIAWATDPGLEREENARSYEVERPARTRKAARRAQKRLRKAGFGHAFIEKEERKG